MPPLSLEIPIQDLLDVVKKSFGEHLTPRDLKITGLSDEHSPLRAYRLDMISTPDEGEPEIRTFVQKYTHDEEVRVMQSLAAEFNFASLPELMCYASSSDNTWFIVPYYEGDKLAFGQPMPDAIIRTLAAVHARYIPRAAELDWLTRIDTAYIERQMGLIGSELGAHHGRFSSAEHAGLSRLLQTVRDQLPLFIATLGDLPLTLTHGDVHYGNIIHTASSSYILVDWGGARLAPAMIDLANIVDVGSDTWDSYLEAREAEGQPLETEAARREFAWATAMVNMQYMPFAISHLELSTAQEMAEKIIAAIGELGAHR